MRTKKKNKNKKQKYTVKHTKAGVLKYIDELKPKNIKLKGFNDCGAQVFQLLQYTNKKNSIYLQNKLYDFGDIGLHYQEVIDMLNKAYEKSTGNIGKFEWMQINIINYIHDLNQYIKTNEGTIIYVLKKKNRQEKDKS